MRTTQIKKCWENFNNSSDKRYKFYNTTIQILQYLIRNLELRLNSPPPITTFGASAAVLSLHSDRAKNFISNLFSLGLEDYYIQLLLLALYTSTHRVEKHDNWGSKGEVFMSD